MVTLQARRERLDHGQIPHQTVGAHPTPGRFRFIAVVQRMIQLGEAGADLRAAAGPGPLLRGPFQSVASALVVCCWTASTSLASA